MLLGLVVLLGACQPNPTPPSVSEPVPPPPGPSYTAPPRLAPPAAQPPAAKAMTRVPAGRGQSCSQYLRWCVEWCSKNQPGQTGCLDWCRQENDKCRTSGEWTIESESRIVTGLPPRR
ncbi:MAG: hypothetical protein KIT67_29455 [Alphaproteobacteria bacterium]|nr:hypothetical protein [Alphaproteobacteria bacterium]